MNSAMRERAVIMTLSVIVAHVMLLLLLLQSSRSVSGLCKHVTSVRTFCHSSPIQLLFRLQLFVAVIAICYAYFC